MSFRLIPFRRRQKRFSLFFLPLMVGPLLFCTAQEETQRYKVSLVSSVSQGQSLFLYLSPFGEDDVEVSAKLYRNRDDKLMRKAKPFGVEVKKNKKYKGMIGVIPFAITTDMETGEYKVVLNIEDSKGVQENSYPLVVDATEWEKETIKATKSMKEIKSNPKKVTQSQKESQELWGVLTDRIDASYFFDSFRLPIKKKYRLSSPFGSQRIFLYQDDSRSVSTHRGEDFAVPIGTPIYAPADGIVTMAVSRIVTGNTIVIEHLPGVTTVYYHLDTLDVKKGAEVKTGEIIGTVGTTGYSTGPHLHWQMNIDGFQVNPMYFLKEPLLDINGAVDTLK